MVVGLGKVSNCDLANKTEASNLLNVVERQILESLEEVIESGVESYLATGSALKEIRDQRLYREGFKSFDAYVKSRWCFQRDYADKLIDSSETKQKVHTMVGSSGADKIQNERQLRELKSVPDESLAKVIAKASEIAGDGLYG
jgi:hypothetical protein